MKRLLFYFFQGLLFIAPITITFWAIYVTFNYIDGLLINLIDKLLDRHIPGLGLVVLITQIGRAHV